MARGTLIAESLEVGTVINDLPLRVHRLERVRPENISPEQTAAGTPAEWTLLFFDVADEDAERLADVLSGSLYSFGWYVDFATADETFVVFARRVFRYPSGDAAGRSEAQAYALSVGVPLSQTDW
ncbi:hypothetical protein [Cryptosporangium aurantiacum]|uniref:Uncharacterized protein n=1 Tax=Cryptosporangium aurantiacum TaxID=134849 RepID=A0A1M7N3H1_9ACTN|nr:hypothetical protein [Cryptosporangium aurantiacum]SHM98074.1 hypothetical protein SAMN05443668_102401 [Cryptosporangium aurantiacum]